MNEAIIERLLDQVRFDSDGLIAVLAQDHETNQILMLAWMNRDALGATLKTGDVVYYSRSRKKLWRKGESSGQVQKMVEICLDCDRDAVLIRVIQTGVACHTGRKSCFSWQIQGNRWVASEPVLIDPNDLYGEKK